MGIAFAVLKLIKYKLSLAVTLSAVAGYFLYTHARENSLLFLIFGVYCLSGGSAALNQVQEWRRDKLMERTGGRPIPSGRLKPAQALLIALILISAGALILLQAGPLPTLLGLLNVLLYNGLYTPLKPVTSFAVLPGGLVGAVPPMIGWTAAGGTPGHPIILFVCTLMFLWQMPHFWLLTIRYWNEYEAAGFKTLKRTLDDSQIRRLVFFWLAISLIFLLMAPLFGIRLQPWLFILMAALNVAFIVIFYIILFRRSSERMLRLIFILTNVFLTVVLIALILSSLL